MTYFLSNFSITRLVQLGIALFLTSLAVACGGGAGTVGITSGTALYSNAPSAITMASGNTTYTIGGGTAPYKSSSSNPNIATAEVKGTTLSISSLGTGTAQIIITDALGASISISLTVGSGGTPTPLFTTAPSSLTVAVGVTASFTISGGNPAYAVSSSNTSVATVAINGNAFIISGIAAGSAQIAISDSTGTAVTITATVGSGGSGTLLFTTAPSAVTIAIGAAETYSVGGGTAPYTAATSNASIATASIVSGKLIITGIGAGAAQVHVFDATGTSIVIAVTVGSGGASIALYTTAGGAVTLAVSTTNTYTVAGGTAPYTVSSNNTSVASASISGTTLSISSVSLGSAQVLVFDATGSSVTIAVTTSRVGSLAIDVLPNGASGNVGDTLQFVISGGSPSYAITVNNTSIATVSPTSVTTSGGGFSATLLNAGSTDVTIVDSLGQTKTFTITVSQLSTSLRLSPNAMLIAEDSTAGIVLNIYGGTGPYRAFTSDQTLSSVSTSGATLTVTLGSKLGRCINPIDSSGVHVPNGTFDVVITVLDSLGASATTIMTIKDNGVGTGSIAPGAPPCL
ncbi:MAG: hypothetical protein Q7T62_10365 [Undibacterium sp.]|nr:hypothetical protein [Undibacterium sp.]